MGLFREVTGNLPAQRPEVGKGGFVGLKISFRGFQTELLRDPAVDQTVLGGDFGGGAAGDTRGDGFPFRHHAGNTCLLQCISAQQPRHAAADHQHPGGDFAPQRWKMGKICRGFPKRIHSIRSFCQ